MFVSKQILGIKNNWGRKNFWSTKFLDQNVEPKKWIKNFLGPKQFWDQQNFEVQEIIKSNKILGQKIFWVKKI